MDATEAYRRAIEDIKKSMECPQAFACCQPGDARSGAAHVLAGGKLLECPQDRDTPCTFGVDFGTGRFCECPLRTFLLENPPRSKGERV
jgi:hypothetical protein